MRAARPLALVASAVLALTTACSTGGGVDTGSGSGAGSSGSGSGGGTLVAAISAQPDQLDPHKTTAYPSFEVLENVYDTLVVPSAKDLTMVPSLATKWTTSADGLTWTFTLRDGVTFSDGSPFDSADVVYSYKRIIDEKLANAYRFATVQDVTAPDPKTVVITLKQPTPNLLSQIGGFKGMAILPEGAEQKYDLATQAVGTGPFTLQKVSAGSITLKANPKYWGGAPKVDGVEFRFVPEASAALTALRSGDVDWTDNVPPQQVASLQKSSDVHLETTASTDYWYMSMNLRKAPFDNRDVRRAIATAVDRKAVTEAALYGAARPNQAAVPKGSFWYQDYAPFTTSTAEAKKVLAAAGVSTPITMGLMVTNEYPETVAAAQVIASELKPIGIDVDIQTEDFATWLDREGKGDFDAFLLGWLGNIDAFDYYDAQHRTGASNNFQGYSNPQVDQLLTQAATATDQDQRKSLYDQAAKMIVDDVSYLYLYNPDVVQAWKPGLKGYTERADRAINFEDVVLP